MDHTFRHRNKDAIRFKVANGDSTWMVLGRTSEWDDEDVPPPVNTSATAVEEPVCAIKADIKWVYPDPGGIHAYVDNGVETRYSEAADIAAVLTHNATLVLIIGTLIGKKFLDLGQGNGFRQVGFFTDLTPTAGHEDDIFLADADVEDYGHLEALENRLKQPMLASGLYGAKAIFQY